MGNIIDKMRTQGTFWMFLFWEIILLIVTFYTNKDVEGATPLKSWLMGMLITLVVSFFAALIIEFWDVGKDKIREIIQTTFKIGTGVIVFGFMHQLLWMLFSGWFG